MASERYPDFRLKVAGSTYGLPSPYFAFGEWIVYSRERGSSLSWTYRDGAMTPRDGTDPFVGKVVTLEYDVGSGWVLAFAGKCLGGTNRWTPQGWARSYTAIGLYTIGDRVPVTDTNTNSDTHHYNVDPDDWYHYQAELAGRTVGEILENVLVDDTTANALDAQGIGAYTSLSPPTLPTATTDDLDAMTTVPPYHVIVGGEKCLGAIETALRTLAPNHMLHVAADGTVRFLDQRLFGSGTSPYPAAIALEMSDTDNPDLVDASNVQLQVDVANSFPRVVVRGEDYAEMKLFTLDDGGLVESFDHDGLDTTEAKAVWKLSDFEAPDGSGGQARATCSLSGGGIGTTFTITNAGYGYTSAPTIAFSGGGGTGAAATCTIDGDGQVDSVTRTSAGSGYTTAPDMIFTCPDGATGDSGTCTCPSTTTVTVTSADAKKTWGSNYWDQSAGRHGVVWLQYTSGAGVTSRVQRKIVSNTALSAGGTSTLTLDRALPSTDFNEYLVRGYTGGGSIVWRKYTLADSTVKLKIRPIATFPAPLQNAVGTAITMNSTPTAEVLWSSTGNPPEFSGPAPITIDVESGDIYFELPTVSYFGTRANLVIGGASTDGIPTNIRVFLPIATDALTATYPPDSGGPVYEGTSYDIEGITDTLVVTVPQWRDPSQTADMEAYAQELHDSVKDTAIEGMIPLARFDSRFLTPGQGVQLTGEGYSLPFEDTVLPVVECVIRFYAGTQLYRTELRVSNRRQGYTAGQYLKPPTRPLPAVPYGASLGPIAPVLPSMPSAESPTMEVPRL